MKKTNILLLILIVIAAISCKEDNTPQLPGKEREVEIQVKTSSSQTRGTRADSTPDTGFDGERRIDELDLLVFSSTDVYHYRREAYKLSVNNNYRATMLETDEELTVYLFANCRDLLKEWEQKSDRGTTWESIQKELMDLQPQQLVNSPDNFKPLPMWGKIKGHISTTSINKWGPVQLLRSVASVDLYVEKNTKTNKFILTDLHLYYAPNKGYLAPVADDITEKAPSDMTTTLNTLVASTPAELIIEDNGNQITKSAIAGQMYLYDNDVTPATITNNKKFTRAILAGYYDQPDPIYNESEPGVDQRKKSYYPVDFVYSDGTFRPIIRNWKYVFNVTGVNGAGYGSLEEAAKNYPIDLNVDVIPWNREDVEIGVEGQYFISMERKDAILWQNVGSTDLLKLTYRIFDNVPGESFSIKFKDSHNGTESKIQNGIKNEYFQVELTHDATNNSADFLVTALKDYTSDHDKDIVVVKFRNLEFEINISQINDDPNNWEHGSEEDVDLDN